MPTLKFVVDAAPDTDRLVPAVLAAYSVTPMERAVVADSDVARVVNFVGFQDDKPMHHQPMVTINALKERLPPAVSSQAIGKQLAELGANVNLQVTAMGKDYGNTVLHELVSDLHASDESNKQLQIIAMLLTHPSTDSAIYNGLGLKLLRAVPMSAVGFFAYEHCMALLARTRGSKQ